MRATRTVVVPMLAASVVGCSSTSGPSTHTAGRSSVAHATTRAHTPLGFVLEDPRSAGRPTPTCLPAVSDWIAKRGSVEVTVNVNGPTTVRVTISTARAALVKSQTVSDPAGTATLDFGHLAAAAVEHVTVSATANTHYRAGRCLARYSATG